MKRNRHKKHRNFMQRFARMNFANATEQERTVLAWLQEHDQDWQGQHVWGHSIMDCWHPRYRVCIEIDGPNHKHQKQAEKDRKRDAAMLAAGIRVLRVTNTQADTGEAMCLISELMGYEWRAEDFHRPIWVSPYER